MSPHANKRRKTDIVTAPPPKDLIYTVWEHYRSYLECQEDSEEQGNEPDVDELHEIVQILEAYVQVQTEDTTLPYLRSSCGENSLLLFPNVESLLPVLLSMVYLHLGDNLISQGFDNDEDNDDADSDDMGHEERDQQKSVEEFLCKSLRYFPLNAAALSMLANYQRMNMIASIEDICCAYEIASIQAKIVRDTSVAILAQDDDDDDSCKEAEDSAMLKEWVELLLLDGIAGAEYIGEDADESEDEVSDDKNRNDKTKDDNDDDDALALTSRMTVEQPKDEFSSSTIEATSSFMAALLHSTLKHHDEALYHLAKFDITHRIHPNVWHAGSDPSFPKNTEHAKSSSHDSIPFQPMFFTGDGVLPDNLYKRLCSVFSPSAMFWKESDYQNRGYFSFYEDISESTPPKNLIDDVVVNYLLPLAQSAVPSEKIVGYEFWTHTRPLKANLGHQMHFDTDEALLAQEKKVTHPVVSSVLYLTGNKDDKERTAGSTIVLSQTPYSPEIATEAFISHAHDRKYTIFPGCCLHGVLPCPGSVEQSPSNKVERLTLLVGFWTRRVPDNMKERHLYGPCSPLPDPNDENTWVKEIQEGYESGNMHHHQPAVTNKAGQIKSDILPIVSPAWEDISLHVESCKESKLQIPTALDHRFFVKNPLSCFRDSLFKNETF